MAQKSRVSKLSKPRYFINRHGGWISGKMIFKYEAKQWIIYLLDTRTGKRVLCSFFASTLPPPERIPSRLLTELSEAEALAELL